jgi:gas vesicle protein
MRDYDDGPTFVIETGGGGSGGTLLLGALLGAAAALLLAPRSGAETQAEIAGAVRRLRDDVGGRVGDARERVSGRVERTRERVSGTIGSVRGEVEARVAQARAALDVGVNAARDARSELQRRVDEAKRSYRDGDGVGAGNGTAQGGDIVITEVATEEDSGDLA